MNALLKKWISEIGIGFHPDTRGSDYTPALGAERAAEYDRDMDAIFEAAAESGADVYGAAVAEMENQKLISGESHVSEKDLLAAEYIDLVGYDPFKDDASISIETVRETLAEVHTLHALASKDGRVVTIRKSPAGDGRVSVSATKK